MRTAVRLALSLGALLVSTSPAHAGLIVESLRIEAVTFHDGTSLSSQASRWETPSLDPAHVVSASVRDSTLAAAARQSPDGFFTAAAAYEAGYDELKVASRAEADTKFRLVVGTDTPDTPLHLRFVNFGSSAFGSVDYGTGNLSAQAGVLISAKKSRLGDGDPVWGYSDTVLLDSARTVTPPDRSDFFYDGHLPIFDVYGIGLPVVRSSFGYAPMGFRSEGRIDRDVFSGEFDFGLLQPGEFFTVTYTAEVRIKAEIAYAGRASASITDPFSLSTMPVVPFAFEGLELPRVGAPHETSMTAVQQRYNNSQVAGAAA